jgi:hypothetical protein
MYGNSLAICWSSRNDNGIGDIVHEQATGFGIMANFHFDRLAWPDTTGRRILKLMGVVSKRLGYDLVVVITDGARPLSEYNLLRSYNHDNEDPWATCVIAVSSADWKGPQPTIAIESERYIGYFRGPHLPHLHTALTEHRKKLHNRGFDDEYWALVSRRREEYRKQLAALQHSAELQH